jgi:hypothetical protein
MLLVGVAYFILVQAVDLVVCCRFHLGPIDAPVFQFIYEHLLFVLACTRRWSIFAARPQILKYLVKNEGISQ